MAQREISQLSPLHIANFWGQDSQRDPAAGDDYGVGVLSLNQGRKLRRPLEPRPGLRPLKAATGSTSLGGDVFAMAGMPVGGKLNLIVRASGGRLLAVKGVEPDTL